ncbi:MAG: serine hydrolase domain-containing protein [Nocardioidaceae bacterium]|nr:serine hydrolase domain-containing protein [Nocardioidaceae bacterium]
MVLVVGAVVALLIGLVLRPDPPRLPERAAGDQALADAARTAAGDRREALAVALVTPDGTRTAVLGAPADAEMEIGSLTKTFTGALYVDAVERGEVEPTTRLGDVLDLGDSPAAGVTLGDLATHTSGLPRLPSSPARFASSLWAQVTGGNPYGEDLPTLLEQARGVDVDADRDEPVYSNLGFSLLGHAVAAAADTDYATLVDERISRPLELGSVSVPRSADDLTDRAVLGRSTAGRTMDAWTGDDLAPAGGVRANVDDLAAYVRALLDGSAPGAAALDPVRDYAGDEQIGAAWLVTERDGRTITWHNGGTGGFSTWLGLDRDAGTAVVLVSATPESVDEAGMTMLLDQTASERAEEAR